MSRAYMSVAYLGILLCMYVCVCTYVLCMYVRTKEGAYVILCVLLQEVAVVAGREGVGRDAG